MTKIGSKRTTPRSAMKKRPPKDYLMDSLWSRVVRGLAGNKCVLCGESNKVLHAHHWVGRRYRATRYLLVNGIAVCHNCHQDIHDFPCFKHDVIKKTIGSDRLEQLEIIARSGIGKKLDKEFVKQELQEKLKLMEEI